MSITRRSTFIEFIILFFVFSLSVETLAQGRVYPAARSGGNYMHNFYFPPSPSSTPWAPAWSPAGDWIAVAMQGSIWKVNPQSGAAFELTYNAAYHSSPDWSPDGRWIIYTADYDHQRIQLEIVDTVTGESHALTDDQAIYTDPVFSLDGTRVAYVTTNPNGYFNVIIREIADGNWTSAPIAVTTDHSFLNSRLYFGQWDMHITPAWFPDGQELLLVSNRDIPLGSGNVLRVPARENGIESAVTVLAEQSLYRTRPDVSIDGKRFVYASTRGAADQFNNLYVQPTQGGEPYKITFFEHDAFHPRWSPDGEWIAFISNEPGVSQLMLLETYGGELKTLHINEQYFKRETGILKVRVLDAESNTTTHSRIHLSAADGKLYAPNETYARVSGRGDPMFHTEGLFELRLPVGEVTLNAVKGFEYYPQTVSAEVESDSVVSLTVSLERMEDMAAKGWYSASTHVHSNYGGNLHNTLENLVMMSRAEDQDLVLEQVANKDNRILDYQYFVPGGGAHPLSSEDQIVVVGQEYRPPFYGHVFMFGLRDHLISPFVTGYEGTAVESLYPSNTDMFIKAKQQGATTGYVHAFGGENDPLQGNLGGGKGFMVDAALGTTDALEWSDASRAGFYPLYAAWNNGLHVTATGGEDSISSLHQSKLVGSVRTYVYTGNQGLNMEAWFDGLRRGRAFVSSGPLLEMQIGDALPGDTVQLPAAGGTVTVTGRLRSVTDLSEVLLVCNGQTVENFPLRRNRNSLDISYDLAVSNSGWCHLRTEGEPGDRFPFDVAYTQALTNPVWLQVGDEVVRNRQAAEYGIAWIDKLEQLADAWPGWRSEREKAHVFGQFEQARQVYRQNLP
ncbi:MAG: CehA/McbA family metallohydrolase [Gammaproteobacteria bacterium]|jgi:TolB protein|nr:CehA/McbA family metallohydrolase [Gammaproteobacteria bacterium]HJO11422.1 CehA/McbA family metallohydrolase [Gammaproteobacteria bacterium]